jgi:glycosyltransferase involved in cell wall biosynthesis
VDLVHANSIRAGMVAVLASRLGGAPAVVHVRDCLPPGVVSTATRRWIGSGAAAVVSNSRHTQDRFLDSNARAAAAVVFNPVDLVRFDPSGIDRSAARASLGIGDSTVVLAVIAQLTPWKAQDDAVRAVAQLKETHPDLRLLLVGSAKFVSEATRYDNRAYVASLERLIAGLGMEQDVVFLGERDDVPDILRASDVVLVPSWEEPFGRSVGEAMAMGVPVVATDVGGPRELIEDGREGRVLPPRQPERWAAALGELLEDRGRREEMGRAARQRARRELAVAGKVDEVLAVYRKVMTAAR